MKNVELSGTILPAKAADLSNGEVDMVDDSEQDSLVVHVSNFQPRHDSVWIEAASKC